MSDRDERRQEQIGHNEAAFRRINEAARTGPGNGTSRTEFVCECGDLECRESIVVGRPEYEEVRANPRRFFVVPGHVEPDAELVVDSGEGYEVVEKFEAAGEIADQTDPRS